MSARDQGSRPSTIWTPRDHNLMAKQLASAGDKTIAVPKMTAPATVAIGPGAAARNCDA